MTARLIPLVLLTLACAKRNASPGQRSLDAGDPGAGWSVVQSGGADHAWYNADLSATIYADSNCGARYEDGALGDLLTHITFGVARGDAVREEQLRVDERDALLRVHDGGLDGMAVKVGAMVVKKHDCVVDVLYIAPPSRFDAGWSSFVSVIEGLHLGSQ